MGERQPGVKWDNACLGSRADEGKDKDHRRHSCSRLREAN